MQTYDLGLAWNWEYDHNFIHGIEQVCHTAHITTYRVDPHNVSQVINDIQRNALFFHAFLDRASDVDDDFLPLAQLLVKKSTHIFNNYDRIEYAKDKANMHLALLGENINVPYTIIISPYNQKNEIELSLTELAHLGRPFIIKPAYTTGGGTGVVIGAETLKQIIESRKHHKNDTYLLQETIRPALPGGQKAWFRVFYAFGAIIPCWWDFETHIYRKVTYDEEKTYKLYTLYDIMHTLRKITLLDFFSSEITLTENHTFVAVDYVNEICDMREQSNHYDGVPDVVIAQIQQQLVTAVHTILKND